MLVRSRQWNCFVVDPWWRDQLRAEIAWLPPDSRNAIQACSSYLDELEAQAAHAS
jgi:hypothetical protein